MTPTLRSAQPPPVMYERFFVPTIAAPLAADLVRLASLRPGERVLDVACGTGVVARLAAQRVGHTGAVAGLDLNPGMLAAARSAAPPGSAITWHEASAEAMPFPDGSFDVALCQMGLQFMPDKAKALSEMRRVLGPGGRLLLNLPGPTPRVFAIMGEALAHHVGAEAAGFLDHVFSLHQAPEIRDLLGRAGFRESFVRSDIRSLRLPAPEEFLWQYVQSTPLAGALQQVSDERRDRLEREIIGKWNGLVEDDHLLLELRMVWASGRA